MDDVKIQSGLAGSMKGKFEHNKSEMISSKRIDLNEEIEAANKRDQEFGRCKSVDGVLENQPVVRDDVFREADAMDDIQFQSGLAGSMKGKFENGHNRKTVSAKKIDLNEEIEKAKKRDQEFGRCKSVDGVLENEPVIRDDVIREADSMDDISIASGHHGALKHKFENGKTSRTTSRKIDVNAEIEEAMRREEEVNMGKSKTVSENEPMVLGNVVRSGETTEDVKHESGYAGSLKDRFEKGAVSNVEDRPKKEPIKIGSLENFDSNQEFVCENTPVVRDDVVRSSSQQVDDDPGIKAGSSRSIKSMFESGPVSNVERKPKEKIKPRSLDDLYGSNKSANEDGVSENTPVVRDDVVRSSSQQADDDPGIKAGSSRSIKSMFESGPVSNVERKPKEKIKPRSLDDSYGGNQSANEAGVSENTPVVRDDVVRAGENGAEPAVKVGGARNLKGLFESGKASNFEVKRQVRQYKPKQFV